MIDALPSPYAQIARKGLSFEAVPLHREVTGDMGRVLWLLMAACGLLLVIGCANVANLSLTRSVSRQREYAVRCALGARGAALVRLQLAESLLLSLAAAGVGLVFAGWARALVKALSAVPIPRAEEIGIDAGVVGFALFAAVLCTLACGAAAALHSTRSSAPDALRDGGRGTIGGAARRRTIGALVVAQLAIVVVLLVASSLLLRSLAKTLGADPGFRPEQAVAVTTYLPFASYADGPRVRQALADVVERASLDAALNDAGVGTEMPLGSWEKGTVGVEPPTGEPDPVVSQIWITGRYLEALGVPLVQGRFFSAEEYVQRRDVAIVSRTLAGQLWPGLDPVGRALHNSRRERLTVIGVVEDVKEGSRSGPPSPQVYEPHAQVPDRLLAMPTIPFFRRVHLVGRSDRPPGVALDALSAALRGTDASLALGHATTLDDVVRDSSRLQRVNTLMVAGFSSAALMLSLLGVAGVLGHGVAERRGEIGVRMALGAQRGQIARLVLGQGARLAGLGIGLGLLMGAATAQLLQAQLGGVAAFDPPTFFLVPLLLLASATLASYLPARRAASIDPLSALRGR